MDLTQLSSQLKVKTDFDAGSSLGLRDINSVTGIVDNSVTSLQALIMKNDISDYDDVDATNFDNTGIKSNYDNVSFIFDLKKDYKFNLSSDITDHYVEDNVAIQDHIGLKPIILDVAGSIGEVDLESHTAISKYNKNKARNENKIAQEIGKKESFSAADEFNMADSYLGRMGSLTSFAPNIVNQARDIYDSTKNVYNTASKTFDFVKDPTGKNKKSTGSGFTYTEEYNEDVIKSSKQFERINWFKTQWERRASFTIVTPYGVLTDMYILDLNASQPENTRYVTNLNIKFKQIRKAKIVRQNRKVAQKMETQLSVEHGSLVIKDEYENINVDATQDMTESMANSNYDLSPSKILNSGSFNVSPEVDNITSSQLEENAKGFGISTEKTKAILRSA